LTLVGIPPSSVISFSIWISESSLATNSSSDSPDFDGLIVVVENAAAYCVLMGFHDDCSKETGRAEGLLIAAAVNRETERGAVLANDLIDSIMKR
jgi:hypothetical protein